MNRNALSSNSFQRIVWADLLRLIAILMVICIHYSDPFNVSAEARSNSDYNLWGSLYGALLRPCVPLFVMLTGMLLLPVKQDMGQFYRKRIPRIIIPFLIWSLLYNLFPTLTGIMGWDNSILSKMFAYAGDNPSQSWENSWHNICMIPFNFKVYTTPLWYIYMLIGLYLYMPFSLPGYIRLRTSKSRHSSSSGASHCLCPTAMNSCPITHWELPHGTVSAPYIILSALMAICCWAITYTETTTGLPAIQSCFLSFYSPLAML